MLGANPQRGVDTTGINRDLALYLENGDASAREELAVKLYAIIFRDAASRCRSLGLPWGKPELEDFTQDVIVKIFRDNDHSLLRIRSRTDAGIASWTITLTRNALIDRWRTYRKKEENRFQSLDANLGHSDDDPFTLADLLPDLADHPQGKLIYAELLDALRRCMAGALDEDESRLVALWCCHYSYKEIALLTERTEKAVTSSIHRAKKKILKALAKEEVTQP